MPNWTSHHLGAAVIALLAFAINISAQTTPSEHCPTITVIAYPGIVEIDQEYTFSVELTGSVPSGLSVEWEIPRAPIVGPKNGKVVRFKTTEAMRGTSVFATVRVSGLPPHCTNTATDFLAVGGEPEPILVSTVTGVTFQSKQMREMMDELEKNPNSQGYIFIGTDPKTERHREIENIIRESALRNGIDQARLTVVREKTAKEIVEIWRVPPGVDNPSCRACEPLPEAACPKITVNGPAGITNPGEVMAFSGTVSGASAGGLTYVWSIVGGELLSGQGTLTPQIKPHGVWEIQVTVTLEVKGLPDGCPNTASEIAGAACNCQPILFDEFSISPNRIDKPRLDALVGSLGKYPNSKLHIIEYFRLRTSEAAVRKKLEMITKYLVGTHRLEPSDYEVVIQASPDDRESTRFYVIPPGADIPTP